MQIIKRKCDGELICQNFTDKVQIVNINENNEEVITEITTSELYRILNEEMNESKKYFRSIKDIMDDIKSLFSEELNLTVDSLGFDTGYPIFRCGNIDGEICREYGCIPYMHLFVNSSSSAKHPDRENGYSAVLVIDFRKVQQAQQQQPDNNDVRMGIWSKEMNADEFHELQRNPMSLWKLFNSIIEEYKERPREEETVRRKSR